MMYFKNCGTLEDLKKQYRRLAMKYHPDCGGSTEIMQAINAEHDALFETLKSSITQAPTNTTRPRRRRQNSGTLSKHF